MFYQLSNLLCIYIYTLCAFLFHLKHFIFLKIVAARKNTLVWKCYMANERNIHFFHQALDPIWKKTKQNSVKNGIKIAEMFNNV